MDSEVCLEAADAVVESSKNVEEIDELFYVDAVEEKKDDDSGGCGGGGGGCGAVVENKNDNNNNIESVVTDNGVDNVGSTVVNDSAVTHVAETETGDALNAQEPEDDATATEPDEYPLKSSVSFLRHEDDDADDADDADELESDAAKPAPPGEDIDEIDDAEIEATPTSLSLTTPLMLTPSSAASPPSAYVIEAKTRDGAWRPIRRCAASPRDATVVSVAVGDQHKFRIREEREAAGEGLNLERSTTTTPVILVGGVPAWKQALIDKKRKDQQAEETAHRRWMEIPEWKRRLLEKKGREAPPLTTATTTTTTTTTKKSTGSKKSSEKDIAIRSNDAGSAESLPVAAAASSASVDGAESPEIGAASEESASFWGVRLKNRQRASKPAAVDAQGDTKTASAEASSSAAAAAAAAAGSTAGSTAEDDGEDAKENAEENAACSVDGGYAAAATRVWGVQLKNAGSAEEIPSGNRP